MSCVSKVSVAAALMAAALAATPSHAVTYEVNFSGANWFLGTSGSFGGQLVIQTAEPVSAPGSFSASSCSLSGPAASANGLACGALQQFDPDGYNTGYSLIVVSVVNNNSGSQTGLLFFEPGSFTNNGVYPIVSGVITDGAGGFYGNFASAGSLTVSAVPEPASWAMMLAGLSLLAWTARRRQF